jgi:polysaccharide export outer membrane protein
MRDPIRKLLKSTFLWVILALLPLVPAHARAEYVLAPGDVLEVSVVGMPDLKHRATIDVDGRASVPLVGTMKAAGLTIAELSEQVKSLLSRKGLRARETDSVVIISPEEVNVEVVEYRPVYLNGDVERPGAQSYRPGMTVRQAIALAGGYDTMRFRSRDPFLDSADFRSDYSNLWIDFARLKAEIARYQAELDGKSAFDPPRLSDVPVPTSATSNILDLESKRFSLDTADFAKQKRYLTGAVAQEDGRISVLNQQTQTEQQDADADAADYKEIKANFSKGILPMNRLSDARRLTLYSATRVLQTTSLLDGVQLKRAELSRDLEKLDDQRRTGLLEKMQDATVQLNHVRSRLQSVSEKLLYAGLARSQLVRGPGGEPDIKVFRSENGTTATIAANDQTELMPGDVVDVKLRLEGTPTGTE